MSAVELYPENHCTGYIRRIINLNQFSSVIVSHIVTKIKACFTEYVVNRRIDV